MQYATVLELKFHALKQCKVFFSRELMRFSKERLLKLKKKKKREKKKKKKVVEANYTFGGGKWYSSQWSEKIATSMQTTIFLDQLQ